MLSRGGCLENGQCFFFLKHLLVFFQPSSSLKSFSYSVAGHDRREHLVDLSILDLMMELRLRF